MRSWKGEAILVQVGARWTYKLRLVEETGGAPQPKIVLGTRIFDTQDETKAASEAHLQEELAKRSG